MKSYFKHELFYFIVSVVAITASMVGLDTIHGQCLSGDQIEKLPELQLEQAVNNVTVFYRVTPRHKLHIVKVRYNLYVLIFEYY